MAKPNHAILIPIVAGYRQSVGKPGVVRRHPDVVLTGPGGGPGGSGYRGNLARNFSKSAGLLSEICFQSTPG